MPGTSRLLVGRLRPLGIPLLYQQVPQDDRRQRGRVGVPGIGRLLVGRLRPLDIPLLPQQVPQADRRQGERRFSALGTGRMPVGALRLLGIPLLHQQIPHDSRQLGERRFGLPGIDRLPVGRLRPLGIPLLPQQVPQGDRRRGVAPGCPESIACRKAALAPATSPCSLSSDPRLDAARGAYSASPGIDRLPEGRLSPRMITLPKAHYPEVERRSGFSINQRCPEPLSNLELPGPSSLESDALGLSRGLACGQGYPAPRPSTSRLARRQAVVR